MRVDIHTHPCSRDSFLRLSHLKGRGIAFAITDHDSVSCLEKARSQGLSFIPGVEVSTAEGHLLLLFVEEAPKKGITVEEGVDFAHERGGIAVAAHPFDPFRPSIGVHAPEKLRLVDALELNQKAPAFANRQTFFVGKLLKKPLLAGSDAHFPLELGLSYVEVEELSPKALLKGRPHVGRQPPTLAFLRALSRAIKSLKW